MTDTALETAIVATVANAYGRWGVERATAQEHGFKARQEPALTVTRLLDDLSQQGCMTDVMCSSRSRNRQAVQAACDRLVRAGRLITSLGLGENGNETRCYEPKPSWP